MAGASLAIFSQLKQRRMAAKAGDVVKSGLVPGKLRNTGHTSASHLHFHVMNRPSPLASDGLPYLIDAFDFAGQVDIAAFEAAPDITGDWGKARVAKPERREREFPLDANIINFPSSAASR